MQGPVQWAHHTNQHQQLAPAAQVAGMRAYAGCPEELPEALRPFKHATALWNGTDDGAYLKWMVADRHFEPLIAGS